MTDPAECDRMYFRRAHRLRFFGAHKNMWRSMVVAVAYSYQQNSKPYRELLNATESFLNPINGEMWLDLGCGSGPVVRSIWERSNGKCHIVGIDLSRKALSIAQKSLRKFVPAPESSKIEFVQADFSKGLSSLFVPESFGGITAGLCISYAESWNHGSQCWDDYAYRILLRDVHSILRDNGQFIFSTNVPGYSYWLLARKSWRQIFLTWKVPLALVVSSIMLYQSRWLRRSVSEGRFHYLPAEEIAAELRNIGFKEVEYKLTYSGQAWVFHARK